MTDRPTRHREGMSVDGIGADDWSHAEYQHLGEPVWVTVRYLAAPGVGVAPLFPSAPLTVSRGRLTAQRAPRRR